MIPIICPKCGYSNQQDSKFCTFCGHDVEFLRPHIDSNFSLKMAEKASMEFPEDESLTQINNHEDFFPYGKDDFLNSSEENEDDIPTVANWNIPTELNTAIDENDSNPRTIIDVRVTNSVNKTTLVLTNPDTDKTFIFPPDKKAIYCGRYNEDFAIDIDLSNLPHSDIVSRVHFIIHIDFETYYIEDAGSSNGTFLNNEEVKSGHIHRQQIHIGDEIKLGKTTPLKLIFQEVENIVYSPSE
ncbi:FHA domain-containing protein [Cyanobacterium stanieri LEGE 03274]|uniref:FHA domain-containing protein n=1 Tax=Cyanobacterium stanieri LEGE 03274 TaxID=1828756 RepID=A0ABR9V0E7_9CHRO|nr:FHA domain-containing protein [Cyanobacterium stanieri]MBE9221071.1 FHA domain-containing protein [Cyanobacterium stanieri LEGE 03274]